MDTRTDTRSHTQSEKARPSDDGRSGRSTPPDDDDDRLAAYAAIYELVVSSPSTPRATLGWMNRMEYHLTRYHDAIPVADADGPPRLRTETDRWRLSLCAIGAKMEFMVLLARAHRIGVGSQWYSCLGAGVRDVRPTMRVFVCGTRRRYCVNSGLMHPRSAAISHSKSPQPAALLTRRA